MTPAEIKEAAEIRQAERQGMHEWGKSLPDRPLTGLMSEINRVPHLTPAEIIASANVTDPERVVKSSLTGFITFAKIDFNCPHCGKKYSDEDDKYVNRCNSNKDFCTSIKCDCGEKFKMTYDITGKAVAWK